MKKIITTFIFITLLISCSHTHSNFGHHQHRCLKNCKMNSSKGEIFNKHCAMAVSLGDMNTAGKFENIFEYGGEIYYFSSKEKMIEFKSNLTTNITNAKRNWTIMDDR